MHGTDLVIAENGDGDELRLTARERGRHLYVTGSTGSGKSKFIEYLIRQDIENWNLGEHSVVLLDWHGSIYKGVMRWLASNRYLDRPVIPIDLTQKEWVVAYNFLRKRDNHFDSVLSDHMVKQLIYCWGAKDTNATPLFERVVSTVFQTLLANGLTIDQALPLLEHRNKHFRSHLASQMDDEVTRANLVWLNSFEKSKDYNATVGSTQNRLQRLLRNKLMVATFSQPEVTFDFRKALDERAIILVSLAQSGVTSQEDARTFATLMLADLWTAIRESGKPEKEEDVRPCYVYIDEFQNFVSPTIAENLDEARGFGLHLCLANQYPSQLLSESKEYGERLYQSIMINVKSKVVFNMPSGKDLPELAEWLFRGTFNPYKVKYEQKQRVVVDQVEETRRARTRSRGTSFGSSETETTVRGLHAGVDSSDPYSASVGHGQSAGDSDSEGESEIPVWVPIWEERTTSKQFLSIDDQKFLAEQRLASLNDREALLRFHEMKLTAEIRTADVESGWASPELVKEYYHELLEQWPFALPYARALELLKDPQAEVLPVESDDSEFTVAVPRPESTDTEDVSTPKTTRKGKGKNGGRAKKPIA
jgi:hypothetical protein